MISAATSGALTSNALNTVVLPPARNGYRRSLYAGRAVSVYFDQHPSNEWQVHTHVQDQVSGIVGEGSVKLRYLAAGGVRAEHWKAMLESGEVVNRVALAKRFGLTPGAVTRILKLADLLPEIRAYLAALRSKQAIRHFGIKDVGPLAALPPDLQRAQFQKLQQGYSPKAA